MENYSGQLGGEEQPLDLTLKVKQQLIAPDEARPNQQEKPLCLIKSCVCNHTHYHEVPAYPPHLQHLPYPPPHHPPGHHHHHPHNSHYHPSMMTGEMIAANNRTPPPPRGSSYPYPSPYHYPVESRRDPKSLSPMGHHLSLPGFGRSFRQEQQRQHMEVPAAVNFRSRSAPAPGCGIFPETAPAPARERGEEHMDTEATEMGTASQAAAPPPAPLSRYTESQGMGGRQSLSPGLQPLVTQQYERTVSPFDVVSSTRGRPNHSPGVSPVLYGNGANVGDVVVSSNAGPDGDYGRHSPAGSCGGSSSDLAADSSSVSGNMAAYTSSVPRPHIPPRANSFHIRNIISVVDDGHSSSRIISRSTATAPQPDEQGPPSTTSTPPPSSQESRPQGAESPEALESPVGESEDGKENLGVRIEDSSDSASSNPGVTHMTALDYLISKVLVERIDVPYKPCNTEIKQIFTGQRKGRLRLVDLIELQVEKSLQA